MDTRTVYDIYRFPHCGFLAAHGNRYCRECGVRFSGKDVEVMKRNIRTAMGALLWNTRDRFRCLHCNEFVSIKDQFCRRCGDQIDDAERQLMRINLSEIASKNTLALIVLALFVLLVIGVAAVGVS